MSLPLLLVGFVISLLFVLTTIIKFKFHPFLSLLLGGILMGIIGGVPLPKIASTMSSGFGSTMGGIGIIIAWGIVLGILLHKSGCTSQIASMMLRAAGEKRAPLAINLTGYLVSIPVFFDAAFVILISLVKQISRKGKIPFISLVTALAVGLITTHAMVIPTPGPLAVAGAMGINIAWFLVYGIFVSLIASLVAGVLYGGILGRKKEYVNDFANDFDDIDESVQDTAGMPSGGLGVFLIFLPIIIILLGTILTQVLEGGTFLYNLFAFLGDKNIALLIGAVVAYLALRPHIKESFEDIITDAAQQAGPIFLITGAGGAFGAIINATGIGAALQETLINWTTAGAAIILLIVAWAISQILRAAQGSTTVALVTTSAIFAPILSGMSAVSPVLVGLAICAGGIGISLPNDSGFWVVNRFSKFSLKQTIQSWTIGGTISGLTALAILIILSLFTGVLPGLL
jgi:GntP family gluconate:H+ symporter